MESGLVRCYEDLILWRKSLDLAAAVHDCTRHFPRSEAFGLASQLRRAAISVPSNVAEGSARGSTREFVYFLRVARGSLAELHTQLHLARREGYVSDQKFEKLSDDLDEVGRILNSVVSGLKRRQTRRSD